MSGSQRSGREIAVVGMSCRYPGAPDLATYWANLAAGVESISRFSPEEMRAAGVDARLLADPRWVGAKAVLEGEALFDAAFFGFTPREAEILDPQHRIFLECAWEALEHAAIDPSRFGGPIAVFAGAGSASYAWNVLARHPTLLASVGAFQMALGNDKDYLATRVSYKLDLRGPSFTVQSACSTSLVAIALAVQSLLAYECDAALAGGSTIAVPQRGGYLYQEGGILSPDGHCRPFDAAARGTAPGSGAGAVLLKRLDDALAAGDFLWAVIEGIAVNNDGAAKVGYTAPSSAGQSEVIALAQALAGVEPSAIGYVEAHGTATSLGDPIEVEALTRVFRESTPERGFCALGSVKSNFGHLDTAAGVAGFQKAVLALHHRAIPPSLHFERPNPAIDFEASPFRVATTLRAWESDHGPRRAGVSSFGIGGTNAHAVLAEAPEREPSGTSRPWQLLLLSAKTEGALEQSTERLRAHLARERAPNELPPNELADVAHTLRVGRRAFARRRAVVCRGLDDALASLSTLDPARVASGVAAGEDRPVVFLFPGQGAQRAGAGEELYHQEPLVRERIDGAAELLAPRLGRDLRELLFPVPSAREQAERELADTRFTQPALFVLEVALAELWRSRGIEPALCLGHSIGELAAAHLAGVFSFEDGLTLVAERGRLLASLPRGAMLALPLGSEAAAELLASEGGAELWISAVNAPDRVTVGGTPEAIEALARRLGARGIEAKPLATSHAFHTPLVEPMLAEWEAVVRSVALSPPSLPYVSNLTGRVATAEQATDPLTWVRHLREPVRFDLGLATLLGDERRIAIEVGPGRTLAALVKRAALAPSRLVLPTLPTSPQEDSESARLLTSLGRAWIAGAKIDWERFAAPERRLRLPLPTYPFERKRFWVDLPATSATGETLEREPAPLIAPAAATPPVPVAHHERPALASAFEPPVEQTERALAAIWAELLGIAPIGRHDDFFELGGDSLVAVRLVAAIEERLGAALPLASVLESPTLARLAARITAGSHAEPIVELAAGGEPALFLLPPVGGTVTAYRELARRLSPHRVVAFQAAGLEPGEEPLEGVEAAAERAEHLLRARQPNGPYHLAGWSFGGLVAWELARRLESAGEKVEHLALIDSHPVPEQAREELLAPERQVEAFFQDLAGRAGLTPAQEGEAQTQRLLRVFQAHTRAAAHFHPNGQVQAPTLLLEAAENLFARQPDAAPSSVSSPRERLAARPAPAPDELPEGAARGRHGRPSDDGIAFDSAAQPAPDELPEGAARGRRGRPSDDGIAFEPASASFNAWQPHLTGYVRAQRVPGNHYSLLTPPNVDTLAAHLARALAHLQQEEPCPISKP